MPPSRRKSCLACVQSKRKCDKGFPKCRRCVTRKTDCDYNARYVELWRQASESSNRNESGTLAESLAEPLAENVPSSDWQLQRSPTPPGAVILNDGMFDIGNTIFDIPSISSDDFFDPAIIEEIVSQQEHVATEPMLPDAALQARVEFAAKRLAMIPKTFAEQGQTMFIHRLLFQDKSPPALQDALSACALYSMKNAQNQALVFRNLEHRRQQLIAGTDPMIVSKLDLLSALQALLLYQLISLFDGNIRLRAQAEADEPILMMWAAHLKSRMRQVLPSLPSPTEPSDRLQVTFADWQQWLVEESIRRTVITAFMLKGVYGFLKLGFDSVPDLRISFTAQAALWNSQSELGWRRACSEKEVLEIQVTHWDQVIARAKPSDLEELGVLIMAMLKGVDAAGRWLGQGYVSRYGLGGSDWCSL
ncbi:hypothetical protein BS50DRAFT_13554 [Corynespora cassiicola Philippines]|uniref:Zn(2)-C6 fungal-type domain-containing protein n=1 Tax=Corynespora cassiicola Philippines TaxID=1448308 RepID=A0A2T2P9I5_CORCC|nr:hypothetical protein BS50DRAFT_13554 [Corynespora cassiicola Philippines]